MISFYKHNLNKNKNYLNKTISGQYLTSGPMCEKVESLLKKKFSKKFAYLTNSWTNAAIAILLALKIKKGDEIIIPACTFVACANVIEMIGGKVIFADIDPKTKLMDINDCLNKITNKTKVIMPVHLYGNLFPTFKLKNKIRKNIFIIEDSAHAFSGEYNNKPLGFYSDFLIFSFYATKSITCGEGGAVLSNNKKAMEKIRSIANNGMSKPAFKRFENNKYKPWDVESFGFKANLSDINACLLKDQILGYKKLSNIKKKIYFKLKKKLSNLKQIEFPSNLRNKDRDFYLFPIGVNRKIRNRLIEHLTSKKIFVTVNFKSITNLSFYKKKYKVKNCLNSIKWGEETLSLPFHAKLKEKEINTIYKEINFFLKKNRID